jgi:hypothetical protein
MQGTVMDTTSNQSGPARTKKPRSRRPKKEIFQVRQVDSTDARLTTHEAVCAERYAGIEVKMTQIDRRFDRMESEIKLMKEDSNRGFAEIKNLIEKKTSGNQQAIITAAGTIIVALIGFLGYLLTHIK